MHIISFLVGVAVGVLFPEQIKKLALWLWEKIKAIFHKEAPEEEDKDETEGQG